MARTHAWIVALALTSGCGSNIQGSLASQNANPFGVDHQVYQCGYLGQQSLTQYVGTHPDGASVQVAAGVQNGNPVVAGSRIVQVSTVLQSSRAHARAGAPRPVAQDAPPPQGRLHALRER